MSMLQRLVFVAWLGVTIGFVFVPRHQSSTKAFYQSQKGSNESDNGDLSVHEFVWQNDREWYETYVINILGRDVAKEKFPIDKEATSNDLKEKEMEQETSARQPFANEMRIQNERENSETIEEESTQEDRRTKLGTEENARLKAFIAANLKEVREEEERALREKEEEKAKEEERRVMAEQEERLKAEKEEKAKREEQTRLKAEEEEARLAAEAKAKAEEEARLAEAKAKAEEEARLKAEAKANAEEEARLAAEAKAKAEEEARLKAEEEAKAKAEEEARLATEAKAKAEEEARLKAEEEAKAKAEEEARLAEAKAKVEEEARLKAEKEARLAVEAKVESKMDKEDRKKEAPSTDTTSVNEVLSQHKTQFILFKDMRNKLTKVPTKELTRLGYSQEEVNQLVSDAIAVITADQIPRPRMGIPPQWKINKADKENSKNPILVDSLEEAEKLLQESEEERAKNKEINIEKSQISDYAEKRRKRQSLQDQKENRDRETDRLNSSPKSRRRSSRMQESKSELRRDTDDEQNQRRRPQNSRRSSRDSGSPKRIYDARQPLNGRSQTSSRRRDDPPTPNFWPDMDTFRELLRSEAELRLRILGEDWTDTVKQESNWRLDLYKEWLWVLHDGVGDSIVPPSRYERSRRSRPPTSRRQKENISLESRRRPRKRNRTID